MPSKGAAGAPGGFLQSTGKNLKIEKMHRICPFLIGDLGVDFQTRVGFLRSAGLGAGGPGGGGATPGRPEGQNLGSRTRTPL